MNDTNNRREDDTTEKTIEKKAKVEIDIMFKLARTMWNRDEFIIIQRYSRRNQSHQSNSNIFVCKCLAHSRTVGVTSIIWNTTYN